jgi:hypothetical protein
LIGRLAFRGIYFPQMKKREWIWLLFQNRGPILQMIVQALMMKLKRQPNEPLSMETQQPEVDSA